MKPFDEIPPGTEDRSRALLEQANALFKEGKFKASEVTFKRVIDLGSNVSEGFYGAGVVRLSLNDQAAAETNFRRALEHDPWHANALYQLGLMAEQREELQEARVFYRKALSAKPGHVEAQKRLAQLNDLDSQKTTADIHDYDRQSERLQDTMIVGLDKPVELIVEDSKIFVAGTRFPIRKETTTIGRSSASDIDLVNDDTASRAHAQLTRLGEQLYVEDMGSTNGTYVNGERITGVVPLGLGDELRVGITSLRRVDSDASADTRIRPAASAHPAPVLEGVVGRKEEEGEEPAEQKPHKEEPSPPQGHDSSDSTLREVAQRSVLVAPRPRWGQIVVAVLLAGSITTIPQAILKLATGTFPTQLFIFGVLHALTLLCGLWAGLAWPGRHLKGLVALGSLAGLLDLAINWSIWQLYSALNSSSPKTTSSWFSWSPIDTLDYLSIIGIAALFTAGGLFVDLIESWRFPRRREEESEVVRGIAQAASGPGRQPSQTTLTLVQALGPSILALLGLIIGLITEFLA
jgi:hypothetical protein